MIFVILSIVANGFGSGGFGSGGFGPGGGFGGGFGGPFGVQSPFQSKPGVAQKRMQINAIFSDGLDAKPLGMFIAAGMLPRYQPMATDGFDSGDAWLSGLANPMGAPGMTEAQVTRRARMMYPQSAAWGHPENEELGPIWHQIVMAGFKCAPDKPCTRSGGQSGTTSTTGEGSSGTGSGAGSSGAGSSGAGSSGAGSSGAGSSGDGAGSSGDGAGSSGAGAGSSGAGAGWSGGNFNHWFGGEAPEAPEAPEFGEGGAYNFHYGGGGGAYGGNSGFGTGTTGTTGTADSTSQNSHSITGFNFNNLFDFTQGFGGSEGFGEGGMSEHSEDMCPMQRTQQACHYPCMWFGNMCSGEMLARPHTTEQHSESPKGFRLTAVELLYCLWGLTTGLLVGVCYMLRQKKGKENELAQALTMA